MIQALAITDASTPQPDQQQASLWLTDAEAAALWGGIPLRTARNRLSQCIRRTIPTKGRPRNQYYVGGIPELVSAATAPAVIELPVQFDRQEKRREYTQVDLTIGRLRLQAVRSYLHIKEVMTEEAACAMTVNEWTVKPRSLEVLLVERLAGGVQRKHREHVTVGGFSATTLRDWARAATDAAHGGPAEQIRQLAPQLRGNVGRKGTNIPDQLLDLVHALAVANPRADLVKALAKAQTSWVGAWPDVSYRTWLRRMTQRDPERFCKTLGKRGLAEFDKQHSPDVERDYLSMSYNEEWQLDDSRKDFYGHGSDPRQILRPYAYSIIRVATRQWICSVTSECPITQSQVRALVGYALASKQGGLPDRIRFERGTIACDDYLRDLLTDLGVSVSKTSMHEGAVAPGFMDDNAKGNFKGKAVVESNIRRGHNLEWDAPGQIGGNEREGSERQQALKLYAARMASNNQVAILPTAAEWQTFAGERLELNNNTPHSGLPMVADGVTGEARNMTPNEYAQHLSQADIRVMDESLLPLFFSKGVMIDVTKNGIRLNNETYGRFDQDLADLVGTKVTAYAVDEFPDAAFVVELGRFVQRYEKADFNENNGQYEQKIHRNKIKKSQYAQMIETALRSSGSEIAQLIRFTANPTPERHFSVVCPNAMKARSAHIEDAGEKLRTSQAKAAARFDLAARPERDPTTPKRRGALAAAQEIQDQFKRVETPITI
jgi:hypothetical protein